MATEDGKGAELRKPILRADGEFELQRQKFQRYVWRLNSNLGA